MSSSHMWAALDHGKKKHNANIEWRNTHEKHPFSEETKKQRSLLPYALTRESLHLRFLSVAYQFFSSYCQADRKNCYPLLQSVPFLLLGALLDATRSGNEIVVYILLISAT
jgi:hypothetical protein